MTQSTALANTPGAAAAQDSSQALEGWRFRAVLALFVASGAAALIDQVCFSKYMSYVVGATAYAVSAVLAAFMAGMMLGAHLGGRWSSRLARPLVAYGLAELAVAVTVLLAPAAFAALTPAYVSAARGADSLFVLSVARWLFALAVVMVPTAALGMTLPLLAPALGATHDARRGVKLGWLYAANTAGGALGALMAAYALLPALGLRRTLAAAASLSALAGASALGLGRRVDNFAALTSHVGDRLDRPQRAPAQPALANEPSGALGATATRPGSALPAELLAVLAFASGTLVFVLEVVSTHLLAVIVGNSAYAFALILAIFLLALFTGAALAPRWQRRFGVAAMPIALATSAATLALTLPLWDLLPHFFGGLGDFVTSFAGRELVRAAVALVILIAPTTCMGLVFPLILQHAAAHRDVGGSIGRLTVLNTLGAVAGALLGGYVLLPRLGSQHTLLGVAALLALTSLFVTRHGSAGEKSLVRLSRLFSVASLLVVMVTPRWDLARLTAGSNVYFDGYVAPKAVLFAEESVHGGVTTVCEDQDGVRTLFTNGKFQGNTGWEMQAQRLFAHYPSLFVEHFDQALVIGLGTGTTLGTYTAYPWKRIDLVEISPAIVSAASTYFAKPNRDGLADPRVRLSIDDGRNHLLTSDQLYDLIGMELSSVWFAGASTLYSREFYELVGAHLTDDGIFQQWVQLHHIDDDVFATILNTLHQEFPHVVLFYGGGQGILVAAKKPLRSSARRLDQLARHSSLNLLLGGRQLGTLLDDAVVTGQGLDAYLQQAAERAARPLETLVSTDDNLFLEYATPKGNVLPWSTRDELVARLLGHREPSAIDALLVR